MVFAFRLFFFACAFSTAAISVRADAFSDLNFLDNFQSGGCSGIWTGMTCRDNRGGNVQTAREKEIAERLAARLARMTTNTETILNGVDELILSYDQIVSEFDDLPDSPSFPRKVVNNVVCLRSNIGAVLLAQRSPDVMAVIGKEKHGADRVFREYNSDPYFHGLVLDHVIGMYAQALKILGDERIIGNEPLHNLILSQIKPALTQLEYLTSEVPLLGTSPDQTVLFAALRVGILNQEVSGLDYPFTGPPCYSYSEPTFVYPKEYALLERYIKRTSPKDFSFEDVLPVSLFSLNLEDSELTPFQKMVSSLENRAVYIYRLGIDVIKADDLAWELPYPIPDKGGVVITSIEAGSPADNVGWQIGDLITGVGTSKGHASISNGGDLNQIIENAGTWETVNVSGRNQLQRIYPIVELKKKQ